MHLKKFAFLICLLLSSCSLFHEDMTKVNELISQKNYTEAIMALDEMESGHAKKLNAKVHVEYAELILSNIKEAKKQRYVSAKEILERAMQLDPKNKDAKTYYLMLLNLLKKMDA